MKVLFASSEVHPLVKTGGLADVAGYLPRALRGHGASVHVIMPAYREVLDKLDAPPAAIGQYRTHGYAVTLLETRLPGSQVKVWLVACPALYDRDGGPYQDARGEEWPDNDVRFTVFAQTVAAAAAGDIRLNWPVDIVHCNDWQCGLIPALLKRSTHAPPTLFTIHNLAYQGLFPYERFRALELPSDLWSHHALEFYGRMSFIKGGLVFADRINTVSPRYAREIQTEAFGCGLDGLLRFRAGALSGILNGIDTREWNPGTDPHLAATYNRRSLENKKINKVALQRRMGLPEAADTPLFGMVSRLTQQKGVDLMIEALPALADTDVQFVVIGTGDRVLEQQLQTLAARHPDRIAIKVAYDESAAHLTIAGADAFLMPSRFEPCGLTQLYSLRYGTVPVVRAVGGLADTVIDADETHLAEGTATGIRFGADTAESLLQAIRRTMVLYRSRQSWKTLQNTGMRHDYSWSRAAEEYMSLYREIFAEQRR